MDGDTTSPRLDGGTADPARTAWQRRGIENDKHQEHETTQGEFPMNADTIKRIVRAIADGSQDDLERLARKVVESERRTGHVKLAEQLDAILSRPRQKKTGHVPTSDSERSLKELPLSRRHGELLASIIPREVLEHHMVLPPATEDRFARIEREYAARERLGAYGLLPRKTILLYGPPGCGKSLGAKRLAWNTGLPLLKVRFDALISSYFGESAANLRSVFIAAKERPCVLLLDECDFIARSRTNSNDIGEASRIVNSLLQLMEDYDAPGLLVATTNIESSLDEALFRRFDDVFQIPLPGADEIEKLLTMTLSAVRVAERISWKTVINALKDAPAAMVVKAAQDAAKAAVLSGEKIVSESLLMNAVSELKHNGEMSSG
jgi:SpoVK/Ycf46/Vps4 family AAA+-type ATPase